MYRLALIELIRLNALSARRAIISSALYRQPTLHFPWTSGMRTLNHLHASTVDPSQSAYRGMFKRDYDFQAYPLAPFGTLVLVHDKPAHRRHWDPHGEQGFYRGPALLHHHSWRTWIVRTQSERISDTLAWFPAVQLRLPGSSKQEMITAALHDLSAIILRECDGTELTVPQRARLAQLHGTATSNN